MNRKNGISDIPAGIETIERMIGIIREKNTIQSPYRSNQASARSISVSVTRRTRL